MNPTCYYAVNSSENFHDEVRAILEDPSTKTSEELHQTGLFIDSLTMKKWVQGELDQVQIPVTGYYKLKNDSAVVNREDLLKHPLLSICVTFA